MKKKRTRKKQRPSLWFNVALVGLVALLGFMVWVASDGYIESEIDHMPPMDEVSKDTMSIGQIIAPITKQRETYILTFEDELPEPAFKEQRKPEVSSQIHADRHQLALIIDDVGYDLKALRRLLALPYTLTIAILPDAPYAKEAAQMAYQHGLQVMLHMPMQTTNPKYQQKMERFYLHKDMSKQEFTKVFESALAKVPHVAGINNHMGSALTEDDKSMVWLMELCEKHGLFFIDSRTSSTSVAAKHAKQAGLDWNERDIFLDHQVTPEALQHAWESALSCIKGHDHCIMLAHPHKETLNFLENNAQGLSHQSFVSIGQVLK